MFFNNLGGRWQRCLAQRKVVHSILLNCRLQKTSVNYFALARVAVPFLKCPLKLPRPPNEKILLHDAVLRSGTHLVGRLHRHGSDHRTIREKVPVLLHNRCSIGRCQDMRVKRHEYSRESSSGRSLNRSLSCRKSTLTNKAPMRLSHARKNSKSYCSRHFHDCGWQNEMKRRASSVV